MMSDINSFDYNHVLKYLGLPIHYAPSPAGDPITFLQHHLLNLPPHLLVHFSLNTTPKQRTVIPRIRNRRHRYVQSEPESLSFEAAKATWPLLWTGSERRSIQGGKEEKRWAEKNFLEGHTRQHVGKLGALLAEYEEEREAERLRTLRRERSNEELFIPEEDEDTDGSEDDDDVFYKKVGNEPEDLQDIRENFERLIRERFIYGLLSVSFEILLKFTLGAHKYIGRGLRLGGLE